MSLQLLKQAINSTLAPSSLRYVYTMYCWKARPSDSLAWPSQVTMARLTALTPQHVRRLVRKLEALSLLSLQRKGNGKGHPSYYKVFPIKHGIENLAKGTTMVALVSLKGNIDAHPKGNIPRHSIDNRDRQDIPPSAAPAARIPEDVPLNSLFVSRLRNHANTRAA